jgi:hypothetical protein
MANADSATNDWDFWIQKMRYQGAKGTGALAVLMVSFSLKVVHEFHIVGQMSGDGLDMEIMYDDYAEKVNVDGGKRISLRSMRGLRGWAEQSSSRLSFGATTGSGSLLYVAASGPFSRPPYFFTGQWLLRRVHHYTDLWS